MDLFEINEAMVVGASNAIWPRPLMTTGRQFLPGSLATTGWSSSGANSPWVIAGLTTVPPLLMLEQSARDYGLQARSRPSIVRALGAYWRAPQPTAPAKARARW